MKKQPDLLVILLAAFGLGVALTLLVPMSSSRTVAEPVSALQAGVFTADEIRSDRSRGALSSPAPLPPGP